jgi:hypothetical protein
MDMIITLIIIVVWLAVRLFIPAICLIGLMLVLNALFKELLK